MSVICPLCGSSDAIPAFIKKDYSHFHCQVCESLYVFPRPSAEELVGFYRRRSQDVISSACWRETADSHRHSWDTWESLLTQVDKLAGHGPLLDMGCGTGQFLAFAREHGWQELTGVELLPEVAQAARKLTGAEIIGSDLMATSLPAESFAGVILWDIVEHLSDVRGVLKEAYRVLRPGGVLVIGTVNRHGLSLRLLRQRALTVSPPEHLTFPTRLGMARAINAAGLDLKSCWSSSVYLQEWTGFLPGVHHTADAQGKRYTQWRSKVTEARFFMAAIRAANLVLKTTNLGDELVAVAQKRAAA